jgi:hypothetical protein
MQNKPNLEEGGRESRGNCVKQTQFAGGRGIIVFPLFQYAIIPPFPSGADCAKQSQFRQSDMRDKCFTRKGLGQTGRAEGLGKTKPIWGRDGRPARPRSYPAVVLLAHPAQKQSQSVATRGTNKANWPHNGYQCRRSGQFCETKPICPHRTREAPGAGWRRTKPISARQDRPDGPGTDHCRRSAGIRHRIPAAPIAGSVGTHRCDDVTRSGRIGVAAAFGDRRWN